MTSRKLFYGIAVVVGLLLLWIILESVSQPGVADLEGKYEEISFYRNENNTGPVVRIYAIYAPDSLWKEMRKYGDFMPHTKYGNTKVFFFGKRENVPEILQPEQPHFDPLAMPFCIAVYEKNALGQVSFTKYPFK